MLGGNSKRLASRGPREYRYRLGTEVPPMSGPGFSTVWAVSESQSQIQNRSGCFLSPGFSIGFVYPLSWSQIQYLSLRIGIDMSRPQSYASIISLK